MLLDRAPSGATAPWARSPARHSARADACRRHRHHLAARRLRTTRYSSSCWLSACDEQLVSLRWPLLSVMQPLVYLRDLEPQPLDKPAQLLIRARIGCPVYGRQDGGVDEYVCLYCCHSHFGSRSYPGWHLASLQASLSWLDRHCSCGHEHVVHDPFGLLNRLPSPSASKISKSRGRKKPTPAPTPNGRSANNSAGAGLSRGTAPAMTWASRRASRPTGSASRRRGERAAEGARS